MNQGPHYVFAFDHRPLMAVACEERRQPIHRVSEFKRLAVDSVLALRDQRSELAPHLMVLIDDRYGSEAITKARSAGLPVGQPIEEGATIPFAFEREDWRASILGARPSFIKARFNGGPTQNPAEREEQEKKILEVSAACAKSNLPFVAEPLLEPKPATAAAGVLADWMTALRKKGVRAPFWKLEGTDTPADAERIADACGPDEGIWILGKSAPIDRLRVWFGAAKGIDRYRGFAVGRTIFWDPFLSYLKGTASPGEVVSELSRRLAQVISVWGEA